MTSPNLVEIRVVAVDQTGPGFDSATKRARALAAAVSGGPGSASAALKEAEKQATGLGSTLKRVGEVAGGVLVADAVQAMARRAVQLVKSTAKAASDLGESVNAVGKTFESSSAQVVQWGQDNANAFGLSQRAFNQMAVPLGAMLKNQGLQLDEVTDHTLKLTQRAADMASVFNTDVSDALIAIQAGLRGEIDPLERYGVSLSAAAVEARALADSGKESAKELTAQEKALARLNILYDQTADTAGDFADTSDGLANSQRIATAQIEDAQAAIGTTFLPLMAKAAQLTGELAGQFGALPGPVQMTAAAIVGLAAAIALLAPKALAAKVALDGMAASDSKLQRGLAKSAKVTAVAGGALAAFTVVGGVAASMLQQDLNPQVDALNKGMDQWADKGKIAGEAARIFGDDAEKLSRALSSTAGSGFSQTMDDITAGIPFFSQTVNEARDRVRLFDEGLAAMVRNGNAEEARRLIEMMAVQTNLSVDQIVAALPAYSGAVEVGGDKTRGLAAAAQEAATSIDELRESTADYLDEAFALEEAQDRVAESVQRLREQIEAQREAGEAGAGTLDRNTEAGRANAEMARDLTRQYSELIIEAAESGDSTDGLRKEFVDLMNQMFGANAATQGYIDKLKVLEQQLAEIKSKEVKVRVKVEQDRIFGGGTNEFAHGGIYGGAGDNAATGGVRGGPVTVNEQGPELARIPSGDIVSLPHGSTVIPSGQSAAMLGGSGIAWVAPIHLHGSGSISIDELRAVIKAAGATLAAIGIRSN